MSNMRENNSRGISNLLFWYLLICFTGITYVILNINYRSPYIEYTHAGYNLAGNDSVAVIQHGEIKDTQSTSERPYYTFIVCVITAPDHFEHRKILREHSWAGYPWLDDNGKKIDSWKYIFVVGRRESLEMMRALEEEIETYQDMVIADEMDSYHNLVLKVLWLLQYAVNNYNFGFLLKTDDDTFINIKLLNSFMTGLLNGDNAQLFYGGVKTGSQPVLRHGRYGVSKEQWEPDTYAPYCSGSGYVLSYDAAQKMLRIYTSGVQPLFYVEDAFIGSLAYHAGNIHAVNINGFYWHQKYGCKNRNAILMHYVKLDQMSAFMNSYKAGESYC